MASIGGMLDYLKRSSRRSDFHGISQGWVAAGSAATGKGFQIRPADLARRRTHCVELVGRIVEGLREFVPQCNICESDRSVIIAPQDRYGVPSRTAMCMSCGLIYQVDRFSESQCSNFYESGEYRNIVSKFTESEQGIEQIRNNQIQYARGIIRALAGHLRFPSGAQLLDIGGSAGHVAMEFQDFFGITSSVLDPARPEVDAAQAIGLRGICASFEDWKIDQKYDFVLLCRSIEHVRDLRRVLTKIRECLTPDGYAYCDFIDFTELCHMIGPPEVVTKIDHCFWLTQETADPIFRSLGLEVIAVNISPQSPLLGYLVRKCAPRPLEPMEPAWIQMQIRNLMRVHTEWINGDPGFTSKELFRRQAYRMKRRLVKMFRSES